MKNRHERILDYCKYYANGACPHKAAYEVQVDALIEHGLTVGGLQPRCPRDAQRTKRGVFACICERSEHL